MNRKKGTNYTYKRGGGEGGQGANLVVGRGTFMKTPESSQVLALPTTSWVALSRMPPPLGLPQCLPWGLSVLEMMEFRKVEWETLALW